MTTRLSRWVVALCAGFVVVVPLTEAFRGIDLTDTGFLLTNQAQVFRDPSSVSYWFHLWLPNVLGGLVLSVAGPFGLFASKVMAAVLFWGLVWAVFRLYGPSIHATWLWLGVASSLGFDFIDKINIVHYNNLTVLIFGWVVYFVLDGALNRKALSFGVAGLLLCINVLVRLPNLLGFGLLVIPFLLGSRPRWRDVGGFLAGVFLGVLGLFLALLASGHLTLYIQSVQELLVSGRDPESHYGWMDMVRRPIKETLLALGYGLVAALGFIALGVALVRVRSAVWRRVLTVILASLVGWGALAVLPNYRTGTLVLAGLGYWVAAFVLLRPSLTSPRTRMALILSASVVFLMNWGSDTGVAVSSYALPLVVTGITLVAVRWSWSRLAVLLLLGSSFVYGTSLVATTVYRDSNLVSQTPEITGVGPVLTTPERAGALESLTSGIRRFARPGDPVLIVDSLPLLHYLTGTRPYLDNPWPALFTAREFQYALDSRRSQGLPTLVVVAKANGRKSSWPDPREGSRVHEALLREFLRAEGFVLAADEEDAEYYVQSEK